MTEHMTDVIQGWHAHVYFDAATRDAARALYERIPGRFPDAELGRFHERPVGPHPMWSYQIAFKPEQFGEIVPWLTLNRGGLDVFVHPNSGDARADHSAHVMFLGESYPLDLSIFDD
ncbi:DOPA 4,5-dioxygenase [Thalassobaculum fulvum]|jgi:DOPA 4,5-dioxygenase|uniref:DOPA 4,5-dioxygenase n=1 Tax=Thalassobaculum fulvum TaxID=1633335 RepID=A0A919CR36_9PROT|nr:DOPA 4,5-dioxygenase family protein [Thalassobaculum fulvum]GHD57942.1 DOPA 4,5-dioxygenase [Thalassobaculum fulvum]